jgi:glyoxylase I family protein
MDFAISGLDHVYVTVSDLARAERFYDRAMQALGFRKGIRPIAGEPHLHYFNRALQYTIRPARTDAPADRYRAGAMHHICFQVPDAGAVDEAHRRLCSAGIAADEPRLYPEYRPDYYATFFSDPDGIRIEVVCDTAGRRLVRERWDELTDFVDPVARLLERERQAPSESAQAAADARALTASGDNIFRGAIAPAIGERFEPLAMLADATVERITSSAAPSTEPYDQPHDEWVLLLRGHARLQVGDHIVTLNAGDYLMLPAHTVHRVLATAAGSLWLALHGRAPAQPADARDTA